MNLKTKVYLTFTAILFLSTSTANSMNLEEEYRAPRLWRVGLSSATFLEKSGPVTSSKLGHGFLIRREYQLSNNFQMGIHFAYRRFNQDNTINQLVYGLILQHGISSINPHGFRPFYISYGLLMQSIRVSGTSGNEMAHDTRSAVGYQFLLHESQYFTEFAHNYSRVENLGLEEQSFDHLDIIFGIIL